MKFLLDAVEKFCWKILIKSYTCLVHIWRYWYDDKRWYV